MPQTMTCIEITSPGDADALAPGSRPLPQPAPGEVLIQVAAAGVNRPDVLQRKGLYPPPPGASDLLGLEAAGTIIALGEGVSRWAVGDRVCALLNGGGYATHVTAHQDHCLTIPNGFSMIQAAALPETFFTVWHNVFERGALKAGETLLVHGGSSGIGTTAIQLAKARGATVYTTAGSAEKCAACEALGATRAINYRDEDFVEVLRSAKVGIDVILDMVGGDYLPRATKVLRPDGRHVSIAFLQGSKVEMDFMAVMLKRLTFTGSTLRSQTVAFKAAVAEALRQEVWPLLDAGTLAPVIHSTFPLAQAADAHRLMESSTHIGKVMLTVD
jgi:putative PIG3 family NAD(P)H quinone oxidoreductase